MEGYARHAREVTKGARACHCAKTGQSKPNLDSHNRSNGVIYCSMRRVITESTWAEIRTAYASGIGLREIARNIGISPGTVLARAKRENWAREIQSAKALAKREGVSPSYFTRLVRLSYLAPDITQAILDGRQPRDLTADKLLAHSRLPLTWQEQRTVLGFA